VTFLRRRHHSTASEDAASDAALVARAVADPDAFAALYRRHFPGVYAYCLTLLGEPVEAEDAAAQTFLRAMTGIAGVRDRAKVRQWLFSVAHNAATDQARGRTTPSTAGTMAAAEAVPDPGPGPEAAALAALDLDRLSAALACLSPEDRRVLALRRAGLSGAEIAALLGISREAAKKRQLRAVERLLVAMEAEQCERSGNRGR
jgi:RNA polymerase sigma-70 factor (ECF subfamily)